MAIRHLILRDLGQLRTFVRGWFGRRAPRRFKQIASAAGKNRDIDEVLATILNTTICEPLPI